MQDKHTYIIYGLLGVMLLMLILIYMQVNRPAAPAVNNASNNVVACQTAIAAWNAKYSGSTVNDSARNELSAILTDCSNKIGTPSK